MKLLRLESTLQRTLAASMDEGALRSIRLSNFEPDCQFLPWKVLVHSCSLGRAASGAVSTGVRAVHSASALRLLVSNSCAPVAATQSVQRPMLSGLR